MKLAGRQHLLCQPTCLDSELSLATCQNPAVLCHLMRRQLSWRNEKALIWIRINCRDPNRVNISRRIVKAALPHADLLQECHSIEGAECLLI